jgi:hypothetical protein
MIRLTVGENDQLVTRLTHEQGRRLADSDIVRARPSPYEPDVWEISPQGGSGACCSWRARGHVKNWWSRGPAGPATCCRGDSDHSQAVGIRT